MASSILVRDVLEQVSRHLTDFAPQFTRWTQVELLSFLNDGQRAVAKYLPTACSRIDSIRLSPGTRQSIDFILAAAVIPGDGSAAADVRGNAVLGVSHLTGANGATPGRALRLVDRDVLDASLPGWHAAPASAAVTPTQYTYDPRNPKIFYVCPGVHPSATLWAEVSYLADPVAIPAGNYAATGGSNTTLSIDDKYADDLVNYVMARAYMKESEFAANANLSAAHTNLFTSSVNAQSVALTGVNPNLTTLPMTPAVPAAAR